jgi:hypothetical protein
MKGGVESICVLEPSDEELNRDEMSPDSCGIIIVVSIWKGDRWNVGDKLKQSVSW